MTTETTLQKARRLAKIARSIPKTWTNSANWPDDDLRAVAGLIAARYRVNGAPPLARVYIVQTLNAALSFEALETAGIKDANSFFLIAVKNLWGSDFPEVEGDEQAERIVELARQPVINPPTIEAIFRNGLNERDGTPFIFADWTAGTQRETGKPVETEPAKTPRRHTKPQMKKSKVEAHWREVMTSGNRDLIQDYLTLAETKLAKQIGCSRNTLRACEVFQNRGIALQKFNRENG